MLSDTFLQVLDFFLNNLRVSDIVVDIDGKEGSKEGSKEAALKIKYVEAKV